MNLDELHNHWDALGRTDPFWAILSDPHKKYGHWDTTEFFKTGEEWIAGVMGGIESLGIAPARNRALDFGCGAGRLTQALCHYFRECAGVDVAESMLELANRFNQHGDRCRYYRNPSNDLKLFEDNTFDFIYSVIVLQHMQPRYSLKYIEEFIRVLTPGGLAVFQLPSEVVPPGSRVPCAPGMADGPLPDSAFETQITIIRCPRTQESGSQLLLRVRVKNMSSYTWPAAGAADGWYQIKLGNRWRNHDGAIIVNSDGLTVLPHDLQPLAEVELPLLSTAPEQPGRYVLEFGMLQQGLGWFKDRGEAASSHTVDILVVDRAAEAVEQVQYEQLVRRIQKVVRTTLPEETTVIVASRGDSQLLQLDGRRGWHFPQTDEGVYSGYHPADSAAAIAHLEVLRAKGGHFLLFPCTSFWWLEHYAELRRHLEDHYRLVVREEDTCAIFALRESAPEPWEGDDSLVTQQEQRDASDCSRQLCARGDRAESEPGDFTPQIQMYGVPRPVVVESIEKQGAKIVMVEQDELAGDCWISWTYYVTK